jgi:hypothetical protein
VWLANRAALGAMRYGLTPPWTGVSRVNPHWFQIDPQLVNEIWAVTAPGMPLYAATKSAWAARVMSDGWGVEPTMFYGAMYAAAFFETDIQKLVAIGKGALPSGSRFAPIIDEMLSLHRTHPADWKAARQEAIRICYFGEPEPTRTSTNSLLNAAFGVLALLYGGGDFQRTLDISCALGFDADNQAATLGGLLGVMHGTKGLPRGLLFPYPELNWSLPLNDRYSVVTRNGLPDAGLRDIAIRTARLGELVIRSAGGTRRFENGVEVYEVDPNAAFAPPLEFPAGPRPVIELGQPVRHEFLVTGAGARPHWRIVAGSIPHGLKFREGTLSGTPVGQPGAHALTLEARSGARAVRREILLVVRGENLARAADRILAPLQTADLSLRKLLVIDSPGTLFATSVEALRDGRRWGDNASFLSIGAGSAPRIDHYGYEWSRPQRIGLVSFTSGFLDDATGWFTDLRVEYRDDRGDWHAVRSMEVDPPFPSGPGPYDKAHFAEYLFRFDTVKTEAIRIAGDVGAAGGFVKDPPRFTSISELAVYGPLDAPGPSRTARHEMLYERR